MFIALIVIGVAFIVGGAVVAERYMRQPSGLAVLLAREPVAIADVRDGAVVRIEGTVELLDGTREAPLSRARCVFYERLSHLQKKVGIGEDSVVDWKQVHRAVNGLPFALRDDSGRAIIDPEGATAFLLLHHEEMERPVGSLVDRLDPLKPKNPTIHHTEYVICEGDHLIVIGRAVRTAGDEAAANEGDEPPARVRVRHVPAAPLHLVDPDRAAEA